MTLTFEDFKPGHFGTLGPRHVTREEILAFATEFDPQPMHLDEEAAGARCSRACAGSGWHLCSLTMRMLFDGFIDRTASRARRGQGIALARAVAARRRSDARCRCRPGAGFEQPAGHRHRDRSTPRSATQPAWRCRDGLADHRPSARTDALAEPALMQFFEDVVIGQRRELGSFTFTAERIKAFAAQFDPQRFHLDEEAGRNSLFGGLAASGWHIGSAWMRCWWPTASVRQGSGGARREGRAGGAVAGVSRFALDQTGAGRRHHHLIQPR